MTYDEMVDEISQIPKFGAKASLSNLARYLDIFNHPEEHLRVIHIAGTNGKGSVCAYLDSVLRRCGYHTAMFTSPHLVDMRERFLIDGEMCQKQEMLSAYLKIKEVMNQGDKYQLAPLTFFEILFLISLLIFQKADLDYCIMETGMGGRLDATVLAKPVLCIITSISLDHTAILGDTIPEIAGEKAGIICQGIPVVSVDENNGAAKVIRQHAIEKNAPYYFLNKEDITICKKNDKFIDFSIKSRYYKNDRLTVHSFAHYQVQNAALAALSLHVLDDKIPEDKIREGIASMRWAGRMEEIRDHIYVDGAHNPGAVIRLVESLLDTKERWSLLFAVCEDKDYDTMIKTLSQFPWERVYLTRIEGARGALTLDIARDFRREVGHEKLYTYDDVKTALTAAISDREPQENLLCAGSLYLVGEIERIIGESEDINV